MKARKITISLGIVSVLSLMSVGGYVWAQGPGFGPPPGEFDEGMEENTEPLPPSKVTIEEKDGFRYITSNGIPNHVTGQFPQPGNPSRIQAQNYKFRLPLKPVVTKATLVRHDNFGVAVNGIPFNPATNEFWNNNRAWNYDALSGKIYLGTDSSNAHVQPGGIYHYHGLPNGLIEKLGQKNQMVLIGYGADGFPVYNDYGYTTATDSKSKLKMLHSSYRLKEGNRPGGDEGPGGAYDGTFSADWEYVEGAGDLDECNGRTGVTAEYPKGTYYYVLTEEFPFVPRKFRGTPDPSITPNRPRPGQAPPGNAPGIGGPGGMNGPQGPDGQRGPAPGFGQGGPPPADFGPPPPPPGFGPPPPGFGPPDE